MYPDGGMVDVFVLRQGHRFRVTDHGEALGWLRMQSLSRRRSPKQNLLVEDTCQTLGVTLRCGQLELRPDSATVPSLEEAVLRVAQAAVRVSDLWFTSRTRAVENLADEVQDWLTAKEDLEFERAVKQSGRSGQTWTIDYRTFAAKHTSLVFLLSTGSRGAARRLAEHVLAGFVDLSHLKARQTDLSFVALFDDSGDVWREKDFKLVEEHSHVELWSQPDKLERRLRGA